MLKWLNAPIVMRRWIVILVNAALVMSLTETVLRLIYLGVP